MATSSFPNTRFSKNQVVTRNMLHRKFLRPSLFNYETTRSPFILLCFDSPTFCRSPVTGRSWKSPSYFTWHSYLWMWLIIVTREFRGKWPTVICSRCWDFRVPEIAGWSDKVLADQFGRISHEAGYDFVPMTINTSRAKTRIQVSF